MIEINLLPKDYLKGSHLLALGKAGRYAIAGAAAVVVILVGISFYQIHQLGQLESNIEKANQRAAMLRQDIQFVDALIDVKNKITRRMAAVERLDRHRSAWVRILEDLGRNVPEFIWLASFRETEPEAETGAEQGKTLDDKQSGEGAIVTPNGSPSTRQAEVNGYAFTLNSLAAFMIRMMRSDYFDEVELVSSEEVLFDEQGRVSRENDPSQKGERAYNFVLSCNVHYLSEEELRNLIADAQISAPKETETTSHRRLN